MNPQNDPASSEAMRQALLELHYGLLDDSDAERLHRRIETEPEMAKAWEQTRVIAGKFADAARVTSETTVSPKYLVPAEAPSPVERATPLASDPDEDANDNRSPRSRFHKLWWISLAAAASLSTLFPLANYWKRLPARPDADLRLVVNPIVGEVARARNEYYVAIGPKGDQLPSSNVTDTSTALDMFDFSMPFVPATISYQVVSRGAVLFLGSAKTMDDGPLRIQVPDEIAIPSDATLTITASPRDGRSNVRLSVPLEPTRCLTFLSTDRPVYRPGETMFFRSVTLNRRTLSAHVDVPIRYELLNASGAAVEGALIEGVTERGVGNGAFTIPSSAVGGTYQLIAKSLDGYFPDESLEIEVRRYRAVRLKTDLTFESRSFNLGDRVRAELSVRRADDEIPAGAAASVKALVGGNVIHESKGSLDASGKLDIEFDLPATIADPQGTLAVTIDDGAVTETAARPIPIHTGRVDVDFYPEGGYLVTGLPNRVYFAAHDPTGEPIELAGEILSQAGRVATEIKTTRDGLGRFEFTPEPGQRYSLRVTSPRDLTQIAWLPSSVDDVPVLETGRGVFDAGEPIAINLHSTRERRCLIRVVCRGELVGVKAIELEPGENPIQVPIQPRTAGVIRVTVLATDKEQATPLVERLVYRRSDRQLDVDVTLEAADASLSNIKQPGESVRMTLAARDETGKPVAGAVLGVRVVDDAALSLRQADLPSIKTHFLLTSEVEKPEDLEHADIYLADGPESAEALDLLLGTQGWRRFVDGPDQATEESFRDAIARLIELDGRRGSVVGSPKTNESELAKQMRIYHSVAQRAWKRLVSETSTILLIIGFLWLTGLLLRPKSRSVAVAGVFLLCGSMLTYLGCGQAAPMATDASVAPQQLTQELADQAEMPRDLQAGSAADELMATAEARGRSDDPSRPFVRRFVDAFLGKTDAVVVAGSVEARITEAKLRQWAKSRDLDAKELADRLMEELRFPIRQYAHLHRNSDDVVRRDFTETLYWNPLMVTDSTGTAQIQFELSDSLTLFNVHVDAHDGRGRVGSGEGSIITRIPVQVEPKLPLEVTGGDRIDLPVGIANTLPEDLRLRIQLETGSGLDAESSSVITEVAPGERLTQTMPIAVSSVRQTTESGIKVAASVGQSGLGDEVERTLRIMPDGFPINRSRSGTLAGKATIELSLPNSIMPGSLAGDIVLYPSTQSQLAAGLDSILREPHGCFEQTSSSNYPNVMAFQLMQLDGVVDDRLRSRTESLLRRGYRKLTRYECADLGYEWFGNDPGHEALSAFGLMQFAEMAKVIDVDEEMMERTRNWILNRRDGAGGFKRNPRHLHAWSVDQDVINAYLLWALSEADLAADQPARTSDQLTSELDQMQRVALASQDPYLIALSAITLGNVGRDEANAELRQRLRSMQNPDGSLEGQTTVTQSGGLSRRMETTALAVLAWCEHDEETAVARSAAKWLLGNRQRGGFGSTQATVLALKALVAMHAKMTSDDGGSVEVVLNERVVDSIRWQGRPAEGIKWTMTPAVINALANNSDATLVLRCDAKTELPFSVDVVGWTRQPRTDPACPIEMATSFAAGDSSTSIDRGDSIDVSVEVKNLTDTGQPMTVAVVGLPGGLEPIIESLDRLREQETIGYYELRGREVVLYWRTLAPGEIKSLTIPCVAEIGGRFTGPSSRSYLYYTAESKMWCDPLVVEVTARD